MEITHLLSEGQVTIPQSLRETHQWQEGQELVAINWGDGILLKPKKPFAASTLADVAGCLPYRGQPKRLEDFEAAIQQGITSDMNKENTRL